MVLLLLLMFQVKLYHHLHHHFFQFFKINQLIFQIKTMEVLYLIQFNLIVSVVGHYGRIM
ncbi:MAG: hypothetical protein EBR82_24020 [Caulobacteraceae bacterium]|nr:hypothetical protein [Caulobacteraceae bacterium]